MAVLIHSTEVPKDVIDLLVHRTMKPTDRWAVYQNVDLGHVQCGHIQFLCVGPQRTFTEPPLHFPDTPAGFWWRYKRIGWFNPITEIFTDVAP